MPSDPHRKTTIKSNQTGINSPLLKMTLVVGVAISAFVLGLYTVKFRGGGWDWGNVVGALGAGGFCLLGLFLLIRDFWKPDV